MWIGGKRTLASQARPIAKEVFDSPLFASTVAAMVARLGGKVLLKRLALPERHRIWKMLLSEAARFAWDSESERISVLGHAILFRSLARAVWRQDTVLAGKLCRHHATCG